VNTTVDDTWKDMHSLLLLYSFLGAAKKNSNQLILAGGTVADTAV
jgi:hypothetical protein